jgi:two-component system OmpR family sensor kinase
VTLADGSSCRVTYETAGLLPMPHRPGPFSLPPQLVILGALGGLLFSTLLAWHLSTPIWRLREGFGRLASGELDVRLRGLMGRRRDEIADLARDFDRMAERMQALVESREQLLHDVSHELRSPLARQHTAIGLARQNPQRTASLLDRIEQESSRMDDLVGELLTLSRVEAEGGGFEEYFDLQSLVRVVVNNTRFEAAGDGVDIGLAMAPEGAPDEMFTVRGDSELVRRALENVLRNATRHSPRGSCVAVGVFVDGAANRCTIRVEDSGPGVPPEFLRQMFEPFVRLRKSKGQGVGLGLAIAKRAIAVHGGSIEAANRPEGGLCVTIVLPLEPPE